VHPWNRQYGVNDRILAMIECEGPFLANRLYDAMQGLKRKASNDNWLLFDVLH
jgi:hypothetical protein